MVDEGGREKAVGLALASSLRRAALWLLPRRAWKRKKVSRRDFAPSKVPMDRWIVGRNNCACARAVRQHVEQSNAMQTPGAPWLLLLLCSASVLLPSLLDGR